MESLFGKHYLDKYVTLGFVVIKTKYNYAALANWWPLPHFHSDLESFSRAMKKLKGTQKQKNITYAVVAAALYQIW